MTEDLNISEPEKTEESYLVSLYNSITEENVEELIKQLFFHLSEKNNTPLKFLISSRGGSVEDAFAIYDLIQLLKESTTVETIGVGKIYSASTILISAGTKGMRKATKNCSFMIHSFQSEFDGTTNQLYDSVKQVKNLQEQYIEMLVNSTNFDEKKLRRILNQNRDHYFNAEQALEYGIIDKICDV